MKVLKYFLTIIGTIVFVFVFIPLIVFICLFREPYTTSEDIKKEFYSNYEQMEKIKEILERAEYADISIYNTDYIYEDGEYGTWFVAGEGSIQIEDEEFVNDIEILFKEREYSHIGKIGNTIYFQLWANKDAGSGIAYSTDGNEPVLQFLTKLEELDKNNWYYYEEDFNEWKLNNK